jgi:iron complex outermembrane receptor protein
MCKHYAQSNKTARLAACVLTAVSTVAYGQGSERQSGTGAESNRNVLEEIVVTAVRRETSLQDTSASLVVLSGQRIDDLGVNDTENLQVVVPGLVTSHLNGTVQRPYIRGIGNDLYGIASGNSVATYVDGVYIPNSSQVFQNFHDVDRVEVLKGPQAVLYGRNATGGTILIHTKDPEFTPSFDSAVSYGNYDAVRLNAALTGPLVSDTLAGRISILYSDREAYGKNLPSGEGQDFAENLDLRASLLASFSPNLTANLAFDYSEFKTGDFVKSTNTDSWSYQLTGGLDNYIADPRKRIANLDSKDKLLDRGVSLTLEWATGIGDITSITSYRNFEQGPRTRDNDGVGTPDDPNLAIPLDPPIVLGQLREIGTAQESKQFSQEVFLATPTDRRLQAIVGANYFHEDVREDDRNDFFGLQFLEENLENPAYSVYADFVYELSDKFTLLAGGRYSSEEKDYDVTPLLTDDAANIIGRGATVAGSESWEKFTYRLGFEYRPKDDLLLYFTATDGFKSGGFTSEDPTNTFKPEKLYSYEAGVKATWGAGLTTNLSAFFYDYQDLQVQQVQIPEGISIVSNASSAELWGVDGEVLFRPEAIDNFQVGLRFAVENSEYGDLVLYNDLIPGPQTIVDENGNTIKNPDTHVNVQGNTLKRAPELTGTLFFDAEFALGSGTLSIHPELFYRSRTFHTPFQDTPHSQPSFYLLNANVTYTFDGGNQYFSLYGQNLTDELYATSIEDVNCCIGPIIGAPLWTHFGPPRIYGVRYGYRF